MTLQNSIRSLILVLLVVAHSACKSDKKTEDSPEIKLEEKSGPEIIEVVTNVMDFQVKDTIKSGWNTFKYINKSKETHFILFDKYPEGKSIVDTEAEVGPPFDKGMELINQGKMEEAMAAFGELPEWFSEIVFSGGSGMISPGQSNTFTIKLLPGYYIMECYVKMADGKFHTSMGMTKELIVLNDDSGNQPPESTVAVNISSTEGTRINGEFKKGENIVRVNYEDQIAHENFVGHDVNLVQLGENADKQALEAWMNWATPTGLMTPAPEGVTFMGGTNESPAGSVQYFTVDLQPGNYALISEVPNASEKNMFVEFTVSE